MYPRLVNSFEKLDTLLATEREIGPEQRGDVDTLIHAHYEQRNAHIRNLSVLVTDIKSALSDPIAPEEFHRVRDNILGALAQPAHFESKPVVRESVFDNWKNHYRLDDTDKKANHVRNRWRDLFAWLADHRGFPAEWGTKEGVLRADMARDHGG